MNIGGAELSISFTALIIQAYSYCISIIDSKALSIAIIIRLSIDFSDSIVWLYIDRESLFTGTYFITIYCRYSLDFIIGYFKIFSNAIFNFDSYGISIDFGSDNSKTFSNDVYSFESYGVFVGFSFDNFKASNSFVAWLCMDCERVCTGASLYDSTPL